MLMVDCLCPVLVHNLSLSFTCKKNRQFFYLMLSFDISLECCCCLNHVNCDFVPSSIDNISYDLGNRRTN